MPPKRIPPDHEIMAMAEALRPYVKTGETVTPFIRRNQQRLLDLLDEESWATVARVMTALGMTYSTGKPWTARYIANEFSRATMPRKTRRTARLDTAPAGSVEMTAKPSAPAPSPAPVATSPAAAAPAAAAPKRGFVLKTSPRLPPPEPPTEEEIARRQALNEQTFGKKG
jgi:hypothetical protein